jgi:putative endonuclease
MQVQVLPREQLKKPRISGFFIGGYMQKYFLYILYSERLDRYYVGSSHDPDTRLHFHNTSFKGWTKRGRPWRLVFSKEFSGKTEVLKIERWLKQQKNRSVLEAIIQGAFHWQTW